MHAAHVTLGAERSEVDACTRCLFVWLDADEADAMPRAKAGTTLAPLSPPARRAVARLDVEHQRATRERSASPLTAWEALGAVFGMPIETPRGPLTVLPVVTWLCALACALASLWAWKYGVTRWEDLELGHVLGVRYSGLPKIALVAALHAFAHRDAIHLALVAYFLVVFGGRVEETLGARAWLLLVAVSSAAGYVAHVLFAGTTGDARIGLSAGVAGLLAWYACAFPAARVTWFLWAPAWSRRAGLAFVPLAFGARWMLAAFVALHVLSAVEPGAALPFAACLAGAVAGALVRLGAVQRDARRALT